MTRLPIYKLALVPWLLTGPRTGWVSDTDQNALRPFVLQAQELLLQQAR